MVELPEQCIWKKTKLLTAHSLYQKLGKTAEQRQSNYRALFRNQVGGKLLEDIRQASNKGLVLGNERFIEEVEVLTGKTLKEGKRGRPVGWKKVL